MVESHGQTWNGLGVLVSPPLKRLFKGPPPSFPGFTLWVSRVIPKNNLHHDHVCTDEFTQTGATRLLDSDFEKEDAQVHRRRKSLESTKGGSCSNPQKEVAAQVHLGKYSKFGCHESFAASECLM